MATVTVPKSVTDINAFMEPHPPGTTYKFEKGLFRLNTGITPKNGDTFIGTEKGGKRQTILSGARVLKNWIFDGRCWVHDNQTQQGETIGSEICLPDYPCCDFPEDMFIDDELLKHVPTIAEVRPGTWHFDYSADKVYIGNNPRGHKLEISVLPTLFTPFTPVSDILLEGLIVEKYASTSSRGAVNLGHSAAGALNWECRGCEVRWCHGAGIGNDAVTRALYNYVHHNGNFGFFGAGWDIVIEGNEICYNNTCGYNPYWGAGGSKWVWTTDLMVRGNFSHHNMGVGLWTDVNNLRTTFENNICEYNTLSGIFHEISYEAIIRRNRCRYNGLERTWPWWTANAGISVVSSRNVEVYENYCEDNWQEITGLDDGRGTGVHGPWVLDNFQVHNNFTKSLNSQEGIGRTGVVSNRPFLYDYNHYQLGGRIQPFFINDSSLNEYDWQNRGQDVHGTFER